MQPADVDPKSDLSLADRAKAAAAYLCGEVLFWVGFSLTVLVATYSTYAGLALLLGWVLLFVLVVRRELKRDIEALGDPNDNLRANRWIGKRGTRRRWEDMAVRFAVELLKSITIIIALTLGMGFAAETFVFALSDRDVSGTFGSGLAGIAAGLFGFVIAVVIVLRRIADIED